MNDCYAKRRLIFVVKYPTEVWIFNIDKHLQNYNLISIIRPSDDSLSIGPLGTDLRACQLNSKNILQWKHYTSKEREIIYIILVAYGLSEYFVT